LEVKILKKFESNNESQIKSDEKRRASNKKSSSISS